MAPMKKKVWDFVHKNELLCQQDRVVVGVSGGADSVCLFWLLLALKKEMPMEICVVHVNHGIRGEEAEEDALFVKELCLSNGIDFFREDADIPRLAAGLGMSEEEAGRMVRYEAFRRVKETWGGTKIATAHHMNDQAETILMNAFRGTGLRGLRGMEARSADVVRPLLCVTREEIEEWMRKQNLEFRTDVTNEQVIYTRNRIRNRILPEARLVNEKAVEHLAALARSAGECEAYVQSVSDGVFVRIVEQRGCELFVSEELLKEPELIGKYVLKKVLTECGNNDFGLKDIGAVHLQEMLRLFQSETGKRLELPKELYARRTYGGILVGKDSSAVDKDSDKKCFPVTLPGSVRAGNDWIIHFSVEEYKKEQQIPRKAYTKWFDYDKIKGSLEVRTRRTGDYLVVNVEGGKKKLKDYFIDEKVDRMRRDDIWLLAEGNCILWAVDYRTGESHRVTEDTRRILVVTTEKIGEAQ